MARSANWNRTIPSGTTSFRETEASPQRNPRRFLKLRYLAVLVLCSIAAYHYWTVQRVDLAQLQQKQSQLQTQLSSLKTQNTQLTKEQKQLNDDTYIARYTSSHYHLILPGQVAFDLSH